MKKFILLASILVGALVCWLVYTHFQTQAKKADLALTELKKEIRNGAIVEIKDFTFNPRELVVKKDSVVYWINRDPVKHSATEDNNNFDTGLFARGEKRSVAFEKPGLYLYHSSPYKYIRGRIVVK